MNKITPQMKIRVSSSVQWNRDVDRMYIFSNKTGEFMEINMVGARIVELANGKRTIQNIASIIAKEFKNCPDTTVLIQQILKFVDTCVDKGILYIEGYHG